MKETFVVNGYTTAAITTNTFLKQWRRTLDSNETKVFKKKMYKTFKF